MAIFGLRKVNIYTRLTPPISVDLDESTDKQSQLVQILQPKITVSTDSAEVDLYSPYGNPTQDLWPIIAASSVGFFVLLSIVLYRGLK